MSYPVVSGLVRCWQPGYAGWCLFSTVVHDLYSLHFASLQQFFYYQYSSILFLTSAAIGL